MLSVWLIIYLLLAGLAIVQGLLVIAQIREHRRFVRSRFRKLSEDGGSGRVMLLIPCRGTDLSLEDNLDTLLQQHYDDYQVRFIVESDADPAYAVIQRIIRQHPEVPCETVVAGQAPCGGQKVHNLRMATANVAANVKYLAFVDSDARLRPDWLRAIVARLDHSEIAVTTGYRWFVPVRSSLANWLLHSINANYALFFGPRTPGFIWGGSWAIRRDLFEAFQMRRAWKGTLSDDLVATRVIRQSSLRAVFEPGCMVCSPLDTNLREMFSFLRRQFIIGRYYAPLWWAIAVAIVLFASVVFWASVGWAAWACSTGRSDWWIPALAAGLIYLISLLRGRIRASTARLYFPHADPMLRRACRFDTWAAPLVGLVHSAALVSSIVGRHLVWRGITYRLSAGGQTQLLRRDLPASDGQEQPGPHCPAAAQLAKPHIRVVQTPTVAEETPVGRRQSS